MEDSPAPRDPLPTPPPASGTPAELTALAALARELPTRVLTPADEDFAAAGASFNLSVISVPAAVIVVERAQEVATVFHFAAARGFDVAVRATGHGAVPFDRPTLLVDTRRLDELTISSDGTARVGAGVRWGAVVAAAAERGLAPLCGSSPSVGVVGYLTGGGIGPVARSFGFGSDLVTAFDLVTADGSELRVSAEEHPELFWALRGGKGALGIVTAVEFRLVPLAELYGGSVFFDGADDAAVCRAWWQWSGTLPDKASTSIAIMRMPELPGVPVPLAGRTTVTVRFAFIDASLDPARVARRYTPAALARLAAVVVAHDPAGVLPEAQALRAFIAG